MSLSGFLKGLKELFKEEVFSSELKYDSKLKWKGDGSRGDQIIAMCKGFEREKQEIGAENLEAYYTQLMSGGRKVPPPG